MIKENSEIIQAFPVSTRTYIGIASSFSLEGHSIIHAAADGDITFDMDASGTVVITVLAGQDLSFGNEVSTITSTAIVWIS